MAKKTSLTGSLTLPSHVPHLLFSAALEPLPTSTNSKGANNWFTLSFCGKNVMTRRNEKKNIWMRYGFYASITLDSLNLVRIGHQAIEKYSRWVVRDNWNAVVIHFSLCVDSQSSCVFIRLRLRRDGFTELCIMAILCLIGQRCT